MVSVLRKIRLCWWKWREGNGRWKSDDIVLCFAAVPAGISGYGNEPVLQHMRRYDMTSSRSFQMWWIDESSGLENVFHSKLKV